MPEQIVNTFDQLRGRLHDGWAISPMYTGTRDPHRCGWKLWRPRRSSDPPTGCYASDLTVAQEYELSHSGDWRARRRAALSVMMDRAIDLTGITPDGWVRNRQGSYVPALVNRERPIPRVTP